MTNLLLKIFIRNYQDTKNPRVRAQYGMLAGIFGIITNCLLCIGKIILGIFSMSLAIISDGINNLTDAGSSIITLIGFKISSTPADEKHPFGHERAEYVTGLIVSLIIMVIGFTLGKDGIMNLLIKPEVKTISYLSIGIMIISIFIKFIQARLYQKLAEKIDSASLKASSKDSRNDCLSTLAVITGLILMKITNLAIFDNIFCILVALFIFLSGLKLAIETISLLLGTKPTQEEINEIAAEFTKYPQIIGIHDLLVHHYGKCTTFATVHVEIASNASLIDSHNLIDTIERNFKNEHQINLTIHLDPVEVDNPEVIKLKNQVSEILASISADLSFHDFRLIPNPHYTKILFDVVVPPHFNITPSELVNIISKELLKIDPNFIPVIQVDLTYNEKKF